ncbi:MAG: MATE family efflux transporter [Ruminococcus sp.]|nr:MATE family efflux transporter [Ruminococcus sp.]
MAQLFIAEGKTKAASMGIAGAGAATCIANYINLIFFLAVYYRNREQLVITLNIREYTTKDGIAKKTLTIGVPAGLGMLLLNGCDFIRNSPIGSYGGQTELASWGVVQKIGNAFMQICVGISQGVRPLVSYNFSAKALKRTKAIVYGVFLIMGVYTVFCVLLTAFIPELLVKLFLPIEDAIPVAVSFLQK